LVRIEAIRTMVIRIVVIIEVIGTIITIVVVVRIITTRRVINIVVIKAVRMDYFITYSLVVVIRITFTFHLNLRHLIMVIDRSSL
jgi:hypothetical protein